MKHARATLVVTGAALLSRLAIVAWAWRRIPPTADGDFYHRIGGRIAEGHGYTWLWPDGVVTYAAHYPVGYPGLVGVLYALFGPVPGAAMTMNALLGTAAAALIHRAGLAAAGPRAALIAGLALALHPALITYTPALMTEGVTASGLAVATFFALRAQRAGGRALWGWMVAAGVAVGLTTLIRPQVVLFAPVFGVIAGWFVQRGSGSPTTRTRARGTQAAKALAVGALALAAALVTVAPWTARNCSRMGRCALVSVNGGWNLLIGTDPAAKGTWAEVKVPVACREVFDEAGKDTCFGAAARATIAAHPGSWAALAPAKLGATFDYFGAGPWYLHAANPGAFDERDKVLWGTLETAFQRVLLGVALFAVGRAVATRWLGARARYAGAALAALVLLPAGWVAVLVFGAGAVLAAVMARELPGPGEPAPAARAAFAAAGAMTLLTAATHAAFFGAGRYGLLIIPAVAMGAALCGGGSTEPRALSEPRRALPDP